MKTKRWAALLLALLLAISGLNARAEEDFAAWLSRDKGWRGWMAASVAQWDDWGAALLIRPAAEDERLTVGFALCLARRQGGSWREILRDTDQLSYPGEAEREQVRFENGRLILSRREIFDGATYSVTEWAYALAGGEWRLCQVSSRQRWTLDAKEPLAIVTESRAWLEGGKLRRETVHREEKTGALFAHSFGPLPDVTDPGWLSPGSGSRESACLTATGYWADSKWSPWTQNILSRLSAAFFPGDEYVDGLYADDALQFILDLPDGARVLRCGRYDEKDSRWVFTESAPLPPETTMGIENFTDCLNLGGGRGVKIGYQSGRWGAVYALGDEWFMIGPNWVGEGPQEQKIYGDHPWGDITGMDWSAVPKTVAEAVSRMDLGRWATPRNPSPQDRLNLRQAPRAGAASLGKYYNGAPVEILEKGKEWCRVRIGGATGWMMTQYLAFGEEAWRVEPCIGSKYPARAQVTVFWQDTGEAEAFGPGQRFSDLLVIGVQGQDWYIVWDWKTGRTGRVRISDTWEGNG